MSAAVWGVIAALGWGTADFMARYTGGALGHRSALLGMLSAGALALTGVIWLGDFPLPLDAGGLWLLAVSGLGTMFGTLLLYRGLARGPVTVVAPIVGAYPALNVVIGIARGLLPSTAHFIAMVVVMLGVAGVALTAPQGDNRDALGRAHVRTSIIIAVGAGVIFALTMTSFQDAMVYYGELQTVWLVRCIALVTLVLLMAGSRDTPRLPLRWFPLLLAQGALDGAAYLALLLGSHGDGASTVIVVSSTFAAVTVVLARVILREAMSLAQWVAIALIVGGVVVLSG